MTTNPQVAVRVPETDYMRSMTRLYLEKIDVRQPAAFDHHLRLTESALKISALNLTNRDMNPKACEVDVDVTYLVYDLR